ncbi:microtubule-associated protein 10 [Engraulis encrasicolus]|uniref:microtubule-associated protein 10 n=1 Tax=Engraulis encrasicolus TaxID=184585 RepID=UPI002FD225B5
MTDPSHKHETLFSFEFLVEYVRLETGSLRSWTPAVGVRLLDFPTLVTYQSDIQQQTDGKWTRTDVDNYNEAYFQKGKSCLFKINFVFLHKHLSCTPLYAMVMDVGHDTPKLIGSSLISLARLVDQIQADVEAYGISTPSSRGERGVHDLCNLMGKKIGQISIACKLVSLGGSLIPHIPECGIHSVGTTLAHETEMTETVEIPAEAVRESAGVMPLEVESSSPVPAPTPTPVHIICQTVQLEGQTKDLVVSEAVHIPVASASTQTEPTQTQKRIRKLQIAEMKYEEETYQEPTLFCPPPMFYSASMQKEDDGEKNIERPNTGTDCLTLADLNTHNESLDSELSPTQEQREGGTIENSTTGSRIPPQPPGQFNLGNGDAIRQLPLLNALLVELSLLNGQSQQQQPLPIHPSLAWIYASPAGPARPPVTDSITSERQTNYTSPPRKARQSSSPRHGCSEQCAKSLAPNSQSRSQRKAKTHKHSQPNPEKTKRKLKYGLTHTYRLRLQRLSSDLPKPRECRQLIHSQETKLDKHKNRVFHSTSSTSMLNTSLHLDDNIETLVCGINVDSSQESSQPKSANRLNMSFLSSGNGSISGHKATSTPRLTVKKNPVHFVQDKDLAIRIPSALSQHSGSETSHHRHTPSPNLSEHTPKAHSVITSNIEKEKKEEEEEESNQGDERWSSPASCLSGSGSGSEEECEEVDYLDDFTSLDPSDGYSPDPLGSPEPRMTRVHSDSSSLDDDDSVRKASSSAAPAPAPLPTPVKAATSPKRSLKGTHLIRQSTRGSGVVGSVSSDWDEVRSAYTPSALSRHSLVRSSHGSQGSELLVASMLRSATTRGTTGEKRDPGANDDDYDHVTQSRGYSEDSFVHHMDPDPEPESSSLMDLNDEEHDELGTLGLTKKYQHISDLMAKKLPGYTL